MTNITPTGRTQSIWQTWLLPHVWVMLYWLAFLLVLEPGNVLRASQAGSPLSMPHEAMRILLAALLGTTVTTAVVTLAERYPLRGPEPGRHLLIYIGGAASLALTLVVASCVVAAWVFAAEWLPSRDEIWDQLVANFTLLMFALSALIALCQTSLWPRSSPKSPDSYAPLARAEGNLQTLTHVEIKRRGQRVMLPLSEVDWIEAQGNYLALQVGAEQHLVRDTMSRFAARLDPGQFLRIHRSMIVAIGRVRQVDFLNNGDALLHLTYGGPLRASRSHNAALKAVAAGLCDLPR